MKQIAFGIGKMIGKNSPHILTGLGILSYTSAIIMTAKAAPIAKPRYDAIKKAKDERLANGEDKADVTTDFVRDTVDEVLPLYLGAISLSVMGTVCVIAADRVNVKRQAALLAACTISEKALDIYQSKVIEKLGSGKHEMILDEVAASDDPFGKNPEKVDIIDDEGVLCYDHVTGRYFKSSIEHVRSAEAAIVKRLIDDTVVSLNDFYTELGLDDISLIGDALGWDMLRVKPDIHFTSMLDKDGIPCLVLNYKTCVVNSGLLYC